MSPLKDAQPVAVADGIATTVPAPVKPTAQNSIDGSENLPQPKARTLTDIQKRAYHGSGIFDEAPKPACVTPIATKPIVVDPISGIKMFKNTEGKEGLATQSMSTFDLEQSKTTLDPSHLTLKELRTACRDRKLNPGGGNEQLCERLIDAIKAGTCAPLSQTLNSSAAGVKRQAPSDLLDRVDLRDGGRSKAPRTEQSTNPVTNAPNSLSEHFKTHKADLCLTEVMNSPKRLDERRVTVSNAKLRDLGVGTDLFNDVSNASDAVSGKFFSDMKAKEALGHGDPFKVDTEAVTVSVKPLSRPSTAQDLHKQTHSIFEAENDTKSIDPHELNKKTSGSRLVSEQMKKSLFEGSQIFSVAEEEKAVQMARLKAKEKDGEVSRVTAHAHHQGHGIFSKEWVVPKEINEDEAIDADVEIEPAVLDKSVDEMNTTTDETTEFDTNMDDGFKPIGACDSPEGGVNLRWKTEAEEEAEEAVAVLVYDAIRKVVDRASQEAFYAEK